MKFDLRRTIRYYRLKFMRLSGDPKSLAQGTAIGIFIGISPTIPFHTIAILVCTVPFRVSTIAALITASAVCNPFTLIPQYYLCWLAGDLIFPGRLTWERIKEVLTLITHESFTDSIHTLGSLSFDAILVMLTGGTILGLPLAIAGYYLSLNFFIKIREKRRKKQVLD